jgi:GNAT superfamily N-acetyltransferase
MLTGIYTLLNSPNKGFYVLAMYHDQIIGSATVLLRWDVSHAQTIFFLSSVFTKPDFRRMGVFSAIYTYIKQAAARSQARVELAVHLNNTRAMDAYHKAGLTLTPYILREKRFH